MKNERVPATTEGEGTKRLASIEHKCFLLGLIMLARELVRVLVSLAFGFRVFEIKWGVGRAVSTKS